MFFILSVFVNKDGKPYKTAGKIDYIADWYFQSIELLQNTSIKATFVSKNSIIQLLMASRLARFSKGNVQSFV